MNVGALVRTMRPKQWVKNLFVAAPLVFSRHLDEPTYLIRTALAVLAFCALSGAVYSFNDVRDVEADRLHPTKQRRPIASGALSERAALTWSAVLAAGALGGCLVLAWELAAIAAAYLAQNLLYSLGLKRIAFVDVGLITVGFLLRVLAGAAAIHVPASRWVLMCTALLALFLGLGKRGHELAWAQRHRADGTSATRAALAGYRIEVVRVLMMVLAVGTCVAFIAYTLSAGTIEFFGTDDLVFVSPFVVAAVGRFLWLALWDVGDEPPTDAMLGDRWFLIAIAGATLTTLFAIYR